MHTMLNKFKFYIFALYLMLVSIIIFLSFENFFISMIECECLLNYFFSKLFVAFNS